MQKKMRLTGIITQGASRMGAAEYIKAFKVASSLDGVSYITYKGDGLRREKVRGHGLKPEGQRLRFLTSSLVSDLQVFVGNNDNDGTKTNMFDPPLVAQFLRIVPVVCRRACTLRMELVGCDLNGKHWQEQVWSGSDGSIT